MPFGASDLGFGVAFTLEDGFTAVAGKIQGGFNSLGNGFTAVSQKLQGGLGASKNGVGSLRSGFDSFEHGLRTNIESLNTFQNALISGGFLLGLSKAVTMASKMSDELSNVTKTTGLAGDALIDFRNNLLDLETRTSIEDLIGISVIGGKMGIAKENLLSFTGAVDKAVVALGDDFSGGAEEVAKRLSIINNLFKETKSLEIGDSLTKIGSTLNALGNAGSNSASNVAEFTNRIGQLGTLAPSVTQTMGLGAALQEVGITAEIASGGVTNLLVTATNHVSKFADQMKITTSEANNLINTDVNEFLLKLGQSFKGMTNVEIGQKLKELHVGSQESAKVMLQLSNNIDLVRERQKLANEAFSEGTSLMQEFTDKNTTLGASFDIFKKKTDAIWVSIGETIKPVVQQILVLFTNLLDGFRKVMETPIGKFFVILAISAGLVFSALVALGTIIPFVSTAFTTLGISVSFALWPFTLITLAVVAVSFVLYKLYKTITTGTERFVAFGVAIGFLLGPIGWVVAGFAMLNRSVTEFKALSEGGEAKTGVLGFLQKVGGVIQGIVEIWRTATNEGFTLSEKTHAALEKIGILKFVVALGTYIVRVRAFFIGVWEGIKAGFITPLSEAFGEIGNAFGGVMDIISSIFDAFGFNLDNAIESLEVFLTVGKFVGKAISFALMPIVWVLKGIAWLIESVNSLFGKTGESVKGIGDGDKKTGKLTATDNIANEMKKSNQVAIQEKEAARQKAGNTTVTVNAPEQRTGQNLTTIIQLDGEVLAKTVNDINQFSSEIGQ